MKSEIKETGIELLDKHHSRLLSVLGMLSETESSTDARLKLERIFYKLGYYVENYFQDEELLFRRYGYPKLSDHKSDHKNFIEGIKLIQKNFLNGSDATGKELQLFLSDWFKKHIINYDNDAVNFLKSKNLKVKD